ncbi:2063_t:CDS:1 [Funneliformis caledonium]|uniref:2063_t:CDS:1 n=1 Tax=Funneliformis caledonium TaxID=1117310 RepID=A0A9N9H9J5_9GLOM|nr:2063_t:CDS:1 [Funneliformis caledonium]
MTFHFFEPLIANASENNSNPKKREPNMFITYRNERMKDRPPNITMTEFSKIVSEDWKKLSEEGKVKLQRKYQIIRDQKMQSIVSDCVVISDQIGKPQTVTDNENPKDKKTKLQINRLQNLINEDKPEVECLNFNISKE